jgi:HlyD family secretion protein
VVFVGLPLLAAGLVAAAALGWSGFLGNEPYNGPTARVLRKKLQITIVERGELLSGKNSDIVCTVKARAQGSTIATQIKWLIDEGSQVKGPRALLSKKDYPILAATSLGLGGVPLGSGRMASYSASLAGKTKTPGEIVVELDDSGIQEQYNTQKIDVDTAEAEYIQADAAYRIDDIQKMTDLKKAENDRDLAKIDLKKYLEGDYIQSKKDILGQIETARSDYEQWKDLASWSARMVRKGFFSKSQADAYQSREDGARIALEKLQESLRVLDDKTWGMKQRTIQDLKTKVDQAERTLKKCELDRTATLAKDEVTRLSKKSVFEQRLAKLHDLEEEIAKCTLRAPQDGMVVYYIPEQTRFGAGSQQSLPAQGEPVREGQKLMQIPDLTQMLVSVRVHEAMVSHLHNEYPDDPSKWQYATIKVDAYPSKVYHGHVKTVATTASTLDFFASDVKVYKTLVSIDDQAGGLRPGMSAVVSIVADESPKPVLTVPVQSVVGTISMGAERKCFVLGPGGRPEVRDIEVGMSNEREVEVKSGLKEGEVIVLNPRPLLPEGSELKAAKVRPSAEEGEGKGPGGAKKGWKKGPAGPQGPGGAGFPGAAPGAPGAAPGGPGAAPGGAGGAKGAMDPAAMQRKLDAFVQELRPLTPQQRRERINARIPEAYRSMAVQAIRAKGVEVPD